MKQSLNIKTEHRLAILGRMRMAHWIEMPEREFAQEIASVEKDPLFQKLYLGLPKTPGVIRRHKWPAGRLGQSFYSLDEHLAAGAAGSVDVENILEDKSRLIQTIQKIGKENFERYFLYSEEAFSLEEISKRTGLNEEEIKAIHGLLNEIDVQSQFATSSPGALPPHTKHLSCLGRLAFDGSEPYVEFNTSYWGRGTYQIRYEQLEQWKHNGILNPQERKRVRHLVNKIEILNLRQNTIYRIVESLASLQAAFLKSRKESDLKPISLRLLAKRLQLAPSTISRATSIRSIQLPWGTEAPLSQLMPGQHKTVSAIMSQWLQENADLTDRRITQRLKQERGIEISRRTVNTVRHELTKTA